MTLDSVVKFPLAHNVLIEFLLSDTQVGVLKTRFRLLATHQSVGSSLFSRKRHSICWKRVVFGEVM